MRISIHMRATVVLIAVLGATGVAGAHAFLDHAAPAVGAQVGSAPTEVKIWFTEEVEEALSSVQVLDAAGNVIDKKDCHRDPKDKKLLIVSLPDKLPEGTYKIVWKVVSTDTHMTNGDFKFTYKAGK
jgi:methionine-rich copper-binding protein CopC